LKCNYQDAEIGRMVIRPCRRRTGNLALNFRRRGSAGKKSAARIDIDTDGHAEAQGVKTKTGPDAMKESSRR
jgi:hypothetical protein